MIVHVILFRERADVTSLDRETFARAVEQANLTIPSVRRFRIGRRLRHGRRYEEAMQEDFRYAAIIEFDDVDGLKAYLNHPAHGDLARLWAMTSEATLVYDYDLRDVVDAAAVLST